jgi:hypothetical protein
MSIACPHCTAVNEMSTQLCGSCGKFVTARSGGPRITNEKTLATTITGQTLQSEELAKTTKTAAGALLAVAILQTLGAAVVFFLLAPNASAAEKGALYATAIITMILSLGFYGLAFWARKQPLIPAIVGTSVLCFVWLLDIIFDPASIARGIFIKILILAVLVRAIQAGLQHRKLKAAMQAKA